MTGWLVAVLAAPLVGPVLYRVLHERPEAVELVDGFVYLAVPLLVAWQVLPVTWELRSPLPLLALGAGLLVPVGMERASRLLERLTDDIAILVGLSGLALHALLEGAAFAPDAEAIDSAFALAVIVHRVPVGLVLWWLVRPRHGVFAAALTVGSLVAATVAGMALAGGLVGDAHGAGVELFQAFVSGSLMHVVFHQGRHDHTHDDHGHHHP